MVAGRAAPGAKIELLLDGEVFVSGTADASGAFALVPPRLPTGSHEITLRVGGPDGRRSDQVVTVMVAPDRGTPPLVTVAAPGQPSIVLSRPDTPVSVAAAGGPTGAGPGMPVSPRPGTAGSSVPTGAPPIRIASVELDGQGRLYVSGTARPGATIRLSVDGAPVRTTTVGPDGKVAISVERGLKPGAYQVRLEEVDPGSGAVLARAEVPFSAPSPVVASAGPTSGPVSGTDRPRPAPTAAPAVSTVPPRGAVPSPMAPAITRRAALPMRQTAEARVQAGTRSTAVEAECPRPLRYRTRAVAAQPRIRTVTVGPGESLWTISQRIYGEGDRYTVIYGANAPAIQDPNVVYPGQVLALPATPRRGASW